MVLYNNTPFQKALNITLFSYNTSLSSVSLGNFPSFYAYPACFKALCIKLQMKYTAINKAIKAELCRFC